MSAVPLASTSTAPAPAIPRTLVVAGVAVLAVAGRLMSGWATPLGFDESFSAVIASQPDAHALLDWCLHEIGGPVYYVLLWAWVRLVGTGTGALRTLSLLFSLAAPLAILRWGHPDRDTRLYWAALLALWVPALEPATNARCYALLMLETTGQAIAFRRLVADPTRPRAFAWTGLSAMAVLTHYHAAVIAGAQGLLLLARRPRDALGCWPALLMLVPMAGWMAVHLPLLARFATQGAWYERLGWVDLIEAPELFFGSALIGYGAVAAAMLGLVRHPYPLRRMDPADSAVALSGVAALAILLAVGLVRPSFSWRYTFMFGPAVLLGISAGIRQAGKSMTLLPALVLAVFAASTGGRIARQAVSPIDGMRYIFNLGRPSDWLVERHATRIGFLWDSPTGRMSDPDRVAEVIGFGPRQAGHPAQVTVLPQPAGALPARIVERAIGQGRIDSLIWLADASVPGTRTMPDPGVLRRHRWRCRDFGGDRIVMLTCRAPDVLR